MKYLAREKWTEVHPETPEELAQIQATYGRNATYYCVQKPFAWVPASAISNHRPVAA